MTQVVYLSAETVIAINRESGGPGAGVLDRAGVEAAVARAYSEFGGVEFYPTLWSKAAVYLHALARTQYFSDGNKRTAWLAANTFLESNDEGLGQLDVDEVEQFVLDVVAGRYEIPAITDWLFKHATPLNEALNEHGACDYCGNEGPLPGAEILPREVMRFSGYREDSMLQRWQVGREGEREYGVQPFHPDRDLISGVCARCRNGWMRSLDRRGLSVLFELHQDEQFLSVNGARDLAAWCVKTALLRSSFEPVIDPAWRARWAERLRKTGRIPLGWTLWGFRQSEPFDDVGRFTHVTLAADGVPDDEHPGLAMPTSVQHFSRHGEIALLACLDDPSVDPILTNLMGALASDGVVNQLWPTDKKLDVSALPALTQDDAFQLGGMFLRMLPLGGEI